LKVKGHTTRSMFLSNFVRRCNHFGFYRWFVDLVYKCCKEKKWFGQNELEYWTEVREK
jgi:hypothetical protein